MNIKKGDRYKCIKDYIMVSGEVAYKKSFLYTATKKDILPSLLFDDHIMIIDDDFYEHFERYRTPKAVADIDVDFQPVIVDSVVESVISNFKNRSEVGIKKYGTTLDRQDIDFLGWVNHLQEELMDAVLYIEKLKKGN